LKCGQIRNASFIVTAVPPGRQGNKSAHIVCCQIVCFNGLVGVRRVSGAHVELILIAEPTVKPRQVLKVILQTLRSWTKNINSLARI